MIGSDSARADRGAVPADLILMQTKKTAQSRMGHEPTMMCTILVILGVQLDSMLEGEREARKVLNLL